jgi:hypothetical protein
MHDTKEHAARLHVSSTPPLASSSMRGLTHAVGCVEIDTFAWLLRHHSRPTFYRKIDDEKLCLPNFDIGVVIVALLVHFVPIGLEKLSEMRSAGARKDWQPSPGIWTQKADDT